jgi:DNA-binding NtrC family response regulator
MGENQQLNILVVDDHASSREALQEAIEREGHKAYTAADAEEALRTLGDELIDIVVTDLRLPGKSGMDILEHVQDKQPDVPVVLITGHGTVDTAVQAMKTGAHDYLTKPIDRGEISRAVNGASRVRRLYLENLGLRRELEETKTFNQMIGASPAMRKVFTTVQQVARTEASVLIEGPNGTGKEMVARAVHDLSSRRDKPYVIVNCAAIPSTLLESELFGHERGAFTGAVKQKKGQLELAHGGTVFMDEIGEMPMEEQSKLLRVLETREFMRVGGTQPLRADFRLVCATNADLKELIAQGRFRQDLYFRINVVHVKLPPLSERREDIPLLVHEFLKQLKGPEGKVKPISADAMRALIAHDWPGNVRELRNAIEHAMVTATGDMITLENLPDSIAPAGHTQENAAVVASPNASLEDVERAHIAAVLQAHNGNKTQAAKTLKIGLKTLYRKLEKYDIEVAKT